MRPDTKNRVLKKRNQKLSEELSEIKKMNFHVREESLQVSLSQHDHNHTHNVTVSDLPLPEVFNAYPQKLQDLMLKRIETDIDNDKALVKLEENEQNIRHMESSGEILLKSRGQIFAFSSLLILLGSSLYFANIGAYKIAGTIVAVTIVGAMTAFSGFSSFRKKDGEKKEKSKNKQ